MDKFFKGFEKAAAIKSDVRKIVPPNFLSTKKNYLQSIAKKRQKTIAEKTTPKIRMVG